MGRINGPQRDLLEKQFGSRVSFRRVERKLYGHDIAAMPALFKPLIGDTTPEGIIQPVSESELTDLVRFASQNEIPLTPRGKATSGYGGAIPLKQGLVVDFYRMNKILQVNPEKQTVTVEAGVVWEKLDKELAKHGLTLRLYPTSYPSSTVGGWLAQGGAGIGSYEAGWFRENVLKARVVLPSGEVKDFSGPELELINDAEGMTGFIAQATLKVQPLEELEVISIGCPHPHDLQRLIESMIAAKLPIWSLMFINPRMAELKNRAPLMEHNGHPVEERILLPAAYIVTLTFRKKDRDSVRGKLGDIIKLCEAEILSDRIADHEWKNRFKLMVVKRLGPSLVPAEVVVPLDHLGKVMTQIERQIDQPLVKEGLVIPNGSGGLPEVVILGFIPSDQRKFGYHFVFGLVLTLMKIAEKNGGRAYSTGMYFTRKAAQVLGTDRLTRMKEFKRQVDPKGFMNPGKVIGNGLVSWSLALASVLEPLARPLGNYITTHVGERPTGPIRDIPADVAWYAYSCSQCGYCIDECDQFYGRGWESQSPRGKWYWLREYMEGREKWDQSIVDAFMVCTTCEMCTLRCSAVLPIEPSWMKLRGETD